MGLVWKMKDDFDLGTWIDLVVAFTEMEKTEG